MAASSGYLLNQLNFGLLPFCYKLWVKTTSVCIDKFSVIGVWKLVVWILRAFSKCQCFSQHELGEKFVVVLKKPNVTKIYLGHCFSCAFVVNVCVCVVDMSVMTLPIIITRIRRSTGGVPAAYRPCQSRTLVYCLNISCHSVLYMWIIIRQ